MNGVRKAGKRSTFTHPMEAAVSRSLPSDLLQSALAACAPCRCNKENYACCCLYHQLSGHDRSAHSLVDLFQAQVCPVVEADPCRCFDVHCLAGPSYSPGLWHELIPANPSFAGECHHPGSTGWSF